MKKIALIALVALTIFSCNNTDYTIKGNAKGIKNGKNVFLQKQDSLGTMITLDTVQVENEKFQFEGNLKEKLSLAFIRFDSLFGSIPMVLEKGTLNIEVIKDTIQKSKLSGTFNNDKIQEYNTGSLPFVNKMMDFQKNNQQKWVEANQNGDTITINFLQNEMKLHQDNLGKYTKEFVEKSPKAYLSVLLLQNLHGTKAVTDAEASAIYDKFDKDLLETKAAKEIKKVLEANKKFDIGSLAPDFSAPSPEGKVISLKESLGKVTIIDFWASWCKPCRMENPNVVAMYNELHEKGLNIIGVSLDKDATSWKDAIAKDGLTWNHISNLKQWEEPIAVQYNVKSIPATFLLDANGVIVAKDLRGEELKAKVKELLGVQ